MLFDYTTIEEIERGPREFIDFLRLSQEHWNNRFESLDGFGTILKDRWIFRGNSDANWRLIPSAWRNNKIIESQIQNKKNRLLNSGRSLDEIPTYEDLYEEAEIDILERFRNNLHDFGYPVQWSLEKNRYNSQKDKFDELLDVACTAQHHGIPTRLLDWTVNPLTAAYFACDPNVRSKYAEKVCVWALNIGSQMFKDNYGDIKIHEQPRNRNDYLRAQQALFTECADGIKIHKNTGKWSSIDEKVKKYMEENTKRPKEQRILIKIVLDKKDADEVVDILRKEGISKSSIMPSLDNLAFDTLNNWLMDESF